MSTAGETRIQLEHVNRIGLDAAPDWPAGNDNDVYRVEIEGSPSITQETAFRFTDGNGRDAATAGCLATGLRALNAVPAVNALQARVGHPAGSAADCRRGNHPLSPVQRLRARNTLTPSIAAAGRTRDVTRFDLPAVGVVTWGRLSAERSSTAIARDVRAR